MSTSVRSVRVVSSISEPSSVYARWCPPKQRMVACTIVSSSLDYCNSVLAEMLEANFNKLEPVQYTLARLVTGMPTYSRSHMTPVLVKLQWLHIQARVSFKIDIWVFKIRQTKQPSCLTELVDDAGPSSTLRSSTCRQCTLRESKTVLVTGARAFLSHCSQNCQTMC